MTPDLYTDLYNTDRGCQLEPDELVFARAVLRELYSNLDSLLLL